MNTVENIGTIPAKRAIILWGHLQAQPTPDNSTRFERTTGIGTVYVGTHTQAPSWTRVLHSSRGACDANWLDGSHWMTYPMSVFLWMVTVEGFASNAAKIAALWEFAKISGQGGWAVDLLRELGEKVED